MFHRSDPNDAITATGIIARKLLDPRLDFPTAPCSAGGIVHPHPYHQPPPAMPARPLRRFREGTLAASTTRLDLCRMERVKSREQEYQTMCRRPASELK